MNNRKITSMAKSFCLGLLAIWLGACTDDSCDEKDTGTRRVILALKARIADAAASNETEEEELMHTLRIVILSKAGGTPWKVEHNEVEHFQTGLRVSKEKEFAVEENSIKRIYLIANEEQVKDKEGNGIRLGEEKIYLPDEETETAPIDNLSFFLRQEEGVGKLPMSAVYDDIRINDTPVTKECHVVRAANKIMFSYTNQTTQIPTEPEPGTGHIFAKKRTIKLLGWTLENIADQSYLMPHVNKNKEQKYWVTTPEENAPRILPGNWIDWMAEEAPASETTGHPNTWLTDYEVPSKTTHGTYTYWYDTEENAPGAPLIKPEADAPAESTWHSTAVYLPESRNETKYDASQANAELKWQQYRLTVITNELDNGLEDKTENWKAASYTAVLPQLYSLFRNTHVQVNITFKGAGQFAIYAEIVPWKKTGDFNGELVPESTTTTKP